MNLVYLVYVRDPYLSRRFLLRDPVKRERIERGWTQEELARRIGVKQATVAKWERKGAVYREPTRRKLARVFEISEASFT